VTAFLIFPVATFFKEIVTPGVVAPDASTTVPDTVAPTTWAESRDGGTSPITTVESIPQYRHRFIDFRAIVMTLLLVLPESLTYSCVSAGSTCFRHKYSGSNLANDLLLHSRGADRCVHQDFHRPELRFAAIL
jgi:hypothetical protein